MSNQPALEPDEIIPPGQAGRGGRAGAGRDGAGRDGAPPVADMRGLLPHFIAKWLDEWLRIPGTNIKFGLDPLLALIPGLGDAASTTAGATILLTAVRHRAPVRLVCRMGGNMVANALLNLIPILGPTTSIWFRSNSRNNKLLQKHLAGEPPGPASPQTKILFAVVLVFVALLFFLSVTVWVVAYRFFWNLFGG